MCESIWDWPAEVLDNFYAGWLTRPLFFPKENGIVRNGSTVLSNIPSLHDETEYNCYVVITPQK